MIQKETLESLINAYMEQQEQHYELIDLHISADNGIVVSIDSAEYVDVDFCADLNRYIQEHLDREAEDYSLEVGSVGLTDPFRTRMQYDKHLGDPVDVLTKDGKKLKGTLVNTDDEAFEVETEVLVQEEGKKRKTKQLQTLRFAYGDVKSVRYDLKV
ncbi:MAG: ribosome assembly cofactor RimP [Paludibacteraceae bacterium]